MEKNNYPWNFCSLGGVVRVKISSGEDIAHLRDLDPKLWTVLSCPVKGLDFDRRTLQLMDTDGDGKIRVDEVVEAAEWLTSVIKDRDLILKGDSSLPLSQINTECEAGKRLYNSAKQILSNLGLEKDSIDVADSSDSVAIFAKTRVNGDGIITPATTDDEELKQTIQSVIELIGSETDRSGEAGIGEAQIEAFWTALADYSAWQAAAKADEAGIFPFGADTEAALSSCEAIKAKVADYFMRCKLIAFDEACAGAVDVSVDKISAISGENLSEKGEQISEYPLARPTKDCTLPFDGINPAWQGRFAAMKTLVLGEFEGKEGISEAEWNAVLAKFDAYVAWKSAKKGAAVEALGTDKVNAILKADRKSELLQLVAEDKAVADEANAIDEVDKLTHLFRDFAKLLRNYVTMLDFYSRQDGGKAIFEAGRLYIDQRCCELCIKVEDMGAHAAMSSLSGMFLIYCTCTSKVKNETMNIAAVMTDGNVNTLRPGMNAVFYDLEGQDWDAVVTKVVDNPVSIKQAFWSPYRKFVNTITERINKNAAEKEQNVSNNMTSTANGINVPADKEAAKAEAAKNAQPPFDIAKFAGIFAAIGMAVAYLTTALAKLVDPWTNILIILLILVICISGPSMFLAWQKLRKRNLGPVLNANGWAINSVILVNIIFGGTLTSIAKYPHLELDDPFVKKKTPAWKKWLVGILAAAIVAAGVLYFTGFFKKDKAAEEPQAVEQVEEPAAVAEGEAAAEAVAETPAAE